MTALLIPFTFYHPAHASCFISMTSSLLESPSVFAGAQLVQAEIGYGKLGLDGELGYDGRSVIVRGQHCRAAFSAHAPSRLVFELDGTARRFDCRVALNDDAHGRDTVAHFIVFVDGREAACAPGVRPGQAPVALAVDVTGAKRIELVALAVRWEHCHTLWLEPRLSAEPPPESKGVQEIVDPLRRVSMTVPARRVQAERCVLTLVSPGYEIYLRDLLLSLRPSLARDSRTALVVIGVDANAACRAVAAEFGAHWIEARSIASVTVAVKSALYSAAQLVDARYYACLDADTIMLGELESLFAACNAAPAGRLLVCREANHLGTQRLGAALGQMYYAPASDLTRILGHTNGEADYPLVVNDGLFAGDREAMMSLQSELSGLGKGIAWMEEKARSCWWRNQFLFNLALARRNLGWELDPAWNVQLHTHDVEFVEAETPAREIRFRGRPVRLLHFCGIGRRKFSDWRLRWRAAASSR